MGAKRIETTDRGEVMPFGCFISSKFGDQKFISKYTWPLGETRKHEKAKLILTGSIESRTTRKRAIGVQLACDKCTSQMLCQINPNAERIFEPKG